MALAANPAQILFGSARAPRALPVCDHYCGNEKLLSKSLSLQAELGPVFDITADCEDGAPIGKEVEHAQMVVAMINSDANKFDRVGIRIHDISHSSWHTDLELIIRGAGTRLAFVTVPKVDRMADLKRVIAAIDDVTFQSGVRRELPVHALIETHGGLACVEEIAAHRRVECVAFGLLDYVSGFGGAIPDSAMASPGQFEHAIVRQAQTRISIAAHSRGKVPAHGVTTDIDNPQAAGNDATRAAAEFGFTRKWSIHPIQIRAIVSALTPSGGLIENAGEILLAAARADWGPIRHRGKLHDRASYRYYWNLLSRARSANAPMSAELINAFFR